MKSCSLPPRTRRRVDREPLSQRSIAPARTADRLRPLTGAAAAACEPCEPCALVTARLHATAMATRALRIPAR
eukprot:scaffold131530_cov60-Phaeocystis_antarctica.AAC.1